MKNTQPEAREILLTGGPMDGKIVVVNNKNVTRIEFPILSPDKSAFMIPPERHFRVYVYNLRQNEDGNWIGE